MVRRRRHQDTREAVFERILGTVLDGPGTLEPALRRAAFDRARSDTSVASSLPDEFAGYVDKVNRHAYRVTDADVEGLRRAGWSEDQIFELTVAAAVGAGDRRLTAGLAALRGAR
jgi:hypothetical protein